MLNLFIVSRASLSPKAFMSKILDFFNYKSNVKKFKLPNRVLDCWQKTGFSLAEILIALLIVSLLLAALAPVMTKRHGDDLKINASKKPGFQAWVQPGVYSFTVPAKVYEIEIQGAGGGGGGGGAALKKIPPIKVFEPTEWNVPKGVNRLSFTLVGAGGDGGAGYGKNGSETACESGSVMLKNMADNGQDLCVVPATNIGNISMGNLGAITVVNAGETCVSSACCWKYNGPQGCTGTGCSRIVCTKEAARTYCYSGKNYNASHPFKNSNWDGAINASRIMTDTEAQRMLDYAAYGNGTNMAIWSWFGFCRQNATSVTKSNLPICPYSRDCLGSVGGNTCYPHNTLTQTGYIDFYSRTEYGRLVKNDSNIIGGVSCVRNLDSWQGFAGAGGSSGSKLNISLDVKPGDKISFGGVYGIGAETGTETTLNNSTSEYPYHNASARKSSACIIHWKLGGWTAEQYGYDMYCALGGVKGMDATSAGNAEATNEREQAVCTKSSRLPDGTRTSFSRITAGCSLAVSENQGMGYAPLSSIKGGSGAGEIPGGEIDKNNGVGSSAGVNQYGYGGGGSVCARSTHKIGKCSEGGKGGRGYIEVTYDIASPGGGGGAGGAVGTYVSNGITQNESLRLKVKPYQSIFVTIGAGGDGGQTASFGSKGGDSKISIEGNENKFIFGGGDGGAPGNFTGTVLNTIQNPGIGGIGGKYSNPKDPDEISLPDNKTQGRLGAQTSHGFDGGQGGDTRLFAKGACGGMQVIKDVCENNVVNGLDALMHNIISNRYGAAGGGGGGIDRNLQGMGGAGAPGFVRIRWTGTDDE